MFKKRCNVPNNNTKCVQSKMAAVKVERVPTVKFKRELLKTCRFLGMPTIGFVFSTKQFIFPGILTKCSAVFNENRFLDDFCGQRTGPMGAPDLS